ncbi:MAG: family 43 glycosylhydrolase [Clostridiales Family XIII bacterium]|nr:family 43 glycosylhydrolase [Clostridiales Family XIII bacterium]
MSKRIARTAVALLLAATMALGWYCPSTAAPGADYAPQIASEDYDASLDISPLAEAQYPLTFRISPSQAADIARITLQDASGNVCAPEADSRTYLLESGTYTYIIRADLYVTDMGVVTVSGETEKAVTLSPTPSSTLTLSGMGQDHKNGSGNNPENRDMNVEGSGYVGWIRNPAWIKFKDVNLLGGVETAVINYARSGGGTNTFQLRLAPSGSLSADTATTVATVSSSINTGGWGAPGANVTFPTLAAHSGGVQDLYVYFQAGEINFGRLTLTLKPEPQGIKSYDLSFGVRPYDAAVTVSKLNGDICAPATDNGKSYNLEEGFYRYTVSRPGYQSQTVLVPVNVSKRVLAVLIPENAVSYSRYEAEDATITGGSPVDNSSFSQGKGAGGFSSYTALGSINSTFSNVSNVKFTVPRGTTGIVELVVAYNSSVMNPDEARPNEDRIAVKSNDGTIKEVYLNPSGKSSVFIDLRAGENTIYVSAPLTPRISNNGNAWIDLDYIELNDATTPGSVEPSEGDEPYVQPKNPIIKSIFTADPEAHVWPAEPNKLYLYPSHDRYPSQGCDLMDQYHVYSTENMVDWVDEGEILRASDLSWQSNPERSFMWAPDAAYKDGYYYFYWPTPTNPANWGATWETGVRRSKYPNKDFEEIPASETYTPDFKGYIEGCGGDGMIDVCVRVFDGQAYIYIGGSQRFFQGKLKDDMVTLDGPLERIPSSVVPSYHEGPSVFKRNGTYYLIYPGGSDSSTGLAGDKFNYCISDSPLGPWQYVGKFFNPTGCDTSHGSVVQFKDKWYLFYHTQELSKNGTLRSVCADEITFNEDGTIQLLTRTFEGPQQYGPDYTRPSPSAILGADDAVVSGAVRSADSSAGYDGKVITDLHVAGSTVTFSDVDGGVAGNRAMLVLHYSTPDDLPKLRLNVNGKDFNYINLPKTGGRSFFSEVTYTTQRLKPGKSNTITLTGGNGKVNLNYVEVILFDDDAPPPSSERYALFVDDGTAKFRNNTGTAVSANLILAVYDAAGRLVYSESERADVAPGAYGKVTFKFNKDGYDGHSVKVFAWSNSFAPLTPPYAALL